jgi:hypothetical protein
VRRYRPAELVKRLSIPSAEIEARAVPWRERDAVLAATLTGSFSSRDPRIGRGLSRHAAGFHIQALALDLVAERALPLSGGPALALEHSGVIGRNILGFSDQHWFRDRRGAQAKHAALLVGQL